MLQLFKTLWLMVILLLYYMIMMTGLWLKYYLLNVTQERWLLVKEVSKCKSIVRRWKPGQMWRSVLVEGGATWTCHVNYMLRSVTIQLVTDHHYHHSTTNITTTTNYHPPSPPPTSHADENVFKSSQCLIKNVPVYCPQHPVLAIDMTW